ncbi:polyketide synthase [Penicillium cosmopolitanum]|uniref:Polyketide synthase n=1 Tax=Penicillium cosmopolitanum TaxID=1131564 RepID=A0A9W9SDS8_9EURO|nr:polyketide synthase [Penicillium cosmopolitanum]KAJ5376155.1 polyketide synthase [Penicillium cosmopolitanum]
MAPLFRVWEVEWSHQKRYSGCLAFIQATVGELDARGIMSLRSGVDCWKTLTQGLVSLYNAGVDIQWGDYHKEYEPGLRLLQLPTYAFDLKKYWLPFNMPQRPDVMTLAGDSHSATSLQQVESDITGENGRHINFLSGSKANYPAYAVQGQGSFDGVAQCPISVWCDMAFNAANHVEFGKHEKMLGIEISGMKVTSPLTIGPENTVNTIIRTSCHFPAGSESLCISIESEKDGEKSRHADCTVQLNNIHRCMSEWGRVGFLLSSRMKYLQNPTNCSTICRLPGSMLYKGFSPLTNYDEKYRSIQEFSLDPDSSEGCGTVKFSSEARGSPRQNPYWIDVFVQFASLILHFNSSTQNNDKGVQYDLDGWESLRTVKDLSAEQSYSIYGRMKSSIESNITTGDIYLFEGDDIVASCFGISFLEITQTPSALPSTPRNHESDYDNNSFSGIQTPDSIENCNSLHETSSRKAVSENGSSSHQPFIDTSTNLEEKALEIISQEISTDVTELEEDTTFSDLGVDSLLSMSIVDKISRDAGLRLAASAFVSHPTVPSFLEHLRKDVLPGLDCEGRSKADGGLPRNNE